jgi:hypothetical protein
MPQVNNSSNFDLREIIFRKTSNVFLNTGIVALYDYLEKFQDQLEGLTFQLNKDELVVSGERLLERLEWVYEEMGDELYNHSQEEGNTKYYFKKNPFEPIPFTTMNSYGLSGFITKPPLGPTPVASKRGEKIKFSELLKKDEVLALKIAEFYLKNKLELKFHTLSSDEGGVKIEFKSDKKKGDSEVFLESPYTKVPDISYTKEHFQAGDQVCSLTGEGFKKLKKSTSTYAFFSGSESGITNFNSFMDFTDKEISWKAMYLCRFAPKYCFYRYTGKFESIFCYLFETDTLTNLKELFDRHHLFMDRIEWRAARYLSNFRLKKFGSKKDNEAKETISTDYVLPEETLFMLIFTIYRNLLMSRGMETGEELEMDIFAEVLGKKHIPLSLVSFRADKFASTMRPTAFEQFNHFKFTVRLMAFLEKQAGGYFFQNLLRSLLFKERSDRSAQDSYRRERRLRNSVLSKLMHQKPVLPDLETFFVKCFLYLNSTDEQDKSEANRKDYDTIFQLVKFYEPIIQRRNMDKEKVKSLQERAIKLGYSIGKSVLEFEGNQPGTNAKQARAYMIHLHKSRTAEQFREAIIRFQKKYGIMVSGELLEAEDMNDDQSFVFIKQFTVMAALNLLNGALKPKSSNPSTTPTPAS